MNNINLVDLLMLMLFAVTMGSLIASSMIRSRRKKRVMVQLGRASGRDHRWIERTC